MSSLSSPTLPSVLTSSIIASTAIRSEQRPRKLGRPTKFSPELWEKLCDLLAQGLTFEQACAHMDIHRDTYAAWCRDPKFSAIRCKAEAARIIALEAPRSTETPSAGSGTPGALSAPSRNSSATRIQPCSSHRTSCGFRSTRRQRFRPNTINIHEKQTNCFADHNKTRRRKNNENDSSNERAFFDNPGRLDQSGLSDGRSNDSDLDFPW